MIRRDRLSCVISAAGLSSRMHEFKPLLDLGGKTVIERTIDSALSAAGSAALVLGHRAQDVMRCVEGKYGDRLKIAVNENYNSTDMLTSIRIGVRAMPECDAFYILPGDMPLIRIETFRILAEQMSEGESAIVFPVINGRRKHPPLISARFRKDILEYNGDAGLRGLWIEMSSYTRDAEVADEGCALDLDYESDYIAALKLLKQRQGT